MSEIDPTRCIVQVADGTGFHWFQCSRKRVMGDFCKQHHPDTVAERRFAANKRREKDEERRRANDPLTIARARIAWLEDCLRLIADGSPPDEWKWYREVPTMTGLDVHYLSHGKRGDQDFVGAPLRNNSESAHVHGWAVGRWEAAKIARKALAQEGPLVPPPAAAEPQREGAE